MLTLPYLVCLALLLSSSPQPAPLPAHNNNHALRVQDIAPHRDGSIMKLQRHHRGIPILGQIHSIALDAQGATQHTHSTLRSIQLPTTSPRLTPQQAYRKALSRLYPQLSQVPVNPQHAAQHTALAIAPTGRTSQFVYVVQMPGLMPHDTRTVHISAAHGRVLMQQPHVYTMQPSANIYPSSSAALEGPSALERKALNNLTPHAAATQLTGSQVRAYSCSSELADLQIFTCDDLLPLLTGVQASCQGNLLIPEEYRQIVIPICGKTQRAAPSAPLQWSLAPQDSRSDIHEPPFVA